jgi:hypothetical protein
MENACSFAHQAWLLVGVGLATVFMVCCLLFDGSLALGIATNFWLVSYYG